MKFGTLHRIVNECSNKIVGVLTLYRCWLVSMGETVRRSSTRDNSPMEGSILIALRSRVNPILSCAQLTEILGSPERKECQ